MSCSIKDGKYFAPNGQESQLYKDLENRVGAKQANDLFIFAYNNPKILNNKILSYNKSTLKKLETFTTNVENLSYKVVKVNSFETIQMYQNNKMLGYIRLKSHNDGLQVDRSLLSKGVEKGIGLGTELYKKAVQYAMSRGFNLYSAKIQTQDAKRVWNKISSIGVAQETDGAYKVEGLPTTYFDKNGEPRADKVLEIATKENESKDTLTTAELVDVQVQFPNYENSAELSADFQKAFYINGQFSPTKKSLIETLYTTYEAENLLSNIGLLSQVKDSIERLKNTKNTDYAVSIESKYKSSDLNMFGKFKVLNPYIEQQNLIDKFGGMQSDEVEDKSITADYKRIPVIDENGEPILDKIIHTNAVKVIRNLENLTEDMLPSYGIDAQKIPSDLLVDFINAPTVQNTEKINKTSPQREKVIKTDNQDRDLVFLETTKTEEQLFKEQGLIQTEIENVYHKVEKVDEQELRDFLKADENTLEHELYKQYYNYNTPSQSNFTPSFTPSLSNLKYLKGEFIADFNAEILKNPTHEFYNKFEVNEKGIILKYGDPISISQIQAYLNDDVKLGEELKQYSSISKNMPNFNNEISYVGDRVWAVNNQSQLKTITSDVTSAIDKNTILAKNQTDDFIIYDGGVFELKNKEGNSSVYMKLDVTQDVNYFQTEVQTQEYTEQIKNKNAKTENYNKINKNYKKDDLEDNFTCL